ncbi:MAG: 16S rRNA (cytosine(1402)-N(4))-methyltransferase RsmH [Gammaproteobacteria bacterium]|nr:16S rRNA (cytosine(1402)-N(4))-methyltransferase RsmH [Gammaproteobacteria bacterium]
MDERTHQSVLLEEAIAALRLKPEGVYVDGTYGRGGHSRMILQQLSAEGRLLVIDKDPAAIAAARLALADDPRTYIYSGSYARLDEIFAQTGWQRPADGILLDLGVSSPQLDDPQRGFSFRQSGPLDMRMDPSRGESAAAWLAHADEQDISHVLKEYGEERFHKRIARAIVKAREESPIDTTQRLAAIVAAAIPTREQGKDPATRAFQGIRIYINQELDDLQQCLEHSVDLLAAGGRLVVISFHSLEDRIVKRFMRKQSKGDEYPLDLPITHVESNAKLREIGKAMRPSEAEVKRNPRARSAIMRVAERLS